ncbi:MAG: CFI-box-CTERM domain-containing protein [Planctomycetota bacterium]|jgi:hypothetical protein
MLVALVSVPGYAADISRVGTWTTGLTHTVGGSPDTDRLLVFVSSTENDGDVDITGVTYGSYAERHAVVLREFRDQYLLPHTLGKSLVHLYYRNSPPLADFINQKGNLRSMTRMGLSPLVGLSILFSWVDLPQRWPLLITMAVIISVLLYMELLVRRQRSLTKD